MFTIYPYIHIPIIKKKGFKDKNFPKAISYFKNCLSLPMHAGLTKKNQKTVINVLKKAYSSYLYSEKKQRTNIKH